VEPPTLFGFSCTRLVIELHVQYGMCCICWLHDPPYLHWRDLAAKCAAAFCRRQGCVAVCHIVEMDHPFIWMQHAGDGPPTRMQHAGDGPPIHLYSRLGHTLGLGIAVRLSQRNRGCPQPAMLG
jgi:hypothetical protein